MHLSEPSHGFLRYRKQQSLAVELIDLHGRSVKRLRVEPGKTTVQLDELASGLYLVRLQQGTAQRQLRLLVE